MNPCLQDAYKLAGISKQSFYLWKKNPEFSEAIKKAQRATIEGITQRLNDIALKAVETLELSLTSANPSIRLRSAQLVLENLNKYKQIEFENRIYELEKSIERGEN